MADATSIAPKHLIVLVLMNLIWGLNLIASKIGVGQFPPIFFTALRFGSVALFLLPLLKIHRGQMGNLFLAAMLTGPAAFSLLFLGLSYAEDAATVAIASQMGVPMSTLLSIWLLGETIRWRRTLGITLAFGGMVIISFDPRVFAYWEGMALVVASTFFASLGTIFVKRLKNIRPLELQAWIALAGGSVLLLFSLLFETGQWQAAQNADWKGWVALAFTAVMSSLVAHTAWYYMISKYPVTSLSPITLLSPLFGIFFGVTLLNDQLTTRMLLGGAVTLIGVFIVVLREKKLVDTGT
ncbi:DMT family transporter [Steroidobacter sp. S1-65]|uniref:DMT family transporter n=1 Tax=Steroidobacter gossypii TaxID=2805490 RepID=A0ABS1WXI3_9GAMM|nr:DMT family transporter [Steroidobacter gossypii]MBM0105689.1 DMT family transporter [Steroidobacter gossypii]